VRARAAGWLVDGWVGWLVGGWVGGWVGEDVCVKCVCCGLCWFVCVCVSQGNARFDI